MLQTTIRVDYLNRNLAEGPFTVQCVEDVTKHATLALAVAEAIRRAQVLGYWVSVTQAAIAHAERAEA
jgi:hypothetical protein